MMKVMVRRTERTTLTGDHSVFLIRDPFIGWEIWIFVNLLDTVSIIKILVTQTDK